MRTGPRGGITAGGPWDGVRMSLVPAVAELRRAVRVALAALPEPTRSAPVLVACSGGADSLALAAAVAALHPGAHAAVVDHGLQDGSAAVAAAAAARLTGLGLHAAVHRVDATGPGGPEASARRARYAALAAARPHPDSAVLLGHTLDDQAETVLLGLGRGSGPRSIAGMRAWDPPWCRPLLTVRRATTSAACAALGLPVWADPHNVDPRFTRARLRHEVLPLLEDVLAGGVSAALARTAAQLREDVDALDALAGDLLAAACAGRDDCGPVGSPDRRGDTAPSDRASPSATSPPVPPSGRTGPGARSVEHRAASAPGISVLAAAPPALRRRAVRAWLAAAGVTGLTDEHLRAADRLVAGPPGVASVALPGGLELARGHERLVLRPAGWPPRSAGGGTSGHPGPRTEEDHRRVRR